MAAYCKHVCVDIHTKSSNTKPGYFCVLFGAAEGQVDHEARCCCAEQQRAEQKEPHALAPSQISITLAFLCKSY